MSLSDSKEIQDHDCDAYCIPCDNITLIALKVVSTKLDELITLCLKEDGNTQAPDRRKLAEMRGYLPPYCKNAYNKKQK